MCVFSFDFLTNFGKTSCWSAWSDKIGFHRPDVQRGVYTGPQ